MSTQTVAQIFETVNTPELCPDISVRDMQWYWGHDMLTGLNQWFWVGPEVESVEDMPNYLSEEPDTKQGCSYNLDRGF